MKNWGVASLILLAVACKSNTQKSSALPPDINVLNFDTALVITENCYQYHGKPFSGYMIQQEKNGRIVYKLPIINGRENGWALGWYNTGEKLLKHYYKD